MTTATDSGPVSLRNAILALALGAFAVGTSEFSAMGLLPYYAADLGISDPQAGHVISAYALGVVVGAPITSLLGVRLPRRRYLAALMAFYGLMNLLAAVMPGLMALTAMRFLAGLPHGGFLGVAMLYAADALPLGQRARGAAQVMLGLTVANTVGVPLAGFLGQSIGWRWGFALPGVLALASSWLILRVAPRVGGNPDARPLDELQALRNPRVLWMLAVGSIGFGGLFAVYAFLTAAILATTQAPSWSIPLTLAMFGLGGTFGTWGAGRVTSRLGPIRAAYVSFAAMAITQAFASFAVGNWQLMVLSSFLLAAGAGLVIPLQTRLMDVAGRAQNMAAAMNHAAFNAANALGPFLAGLALAAGWGWRAPGLVGIGLTAAGAVILTLAVRHERAHPGMAEHAE
ncbi:MFS transporter [Paracoccus seriniphilus]|uniref:MFS transporter, DHA1 family, inner membrane transport protein n=1 Tax=Paracoccus seriniphilus TaxID=184748 RepID=A0A239PXR8_9RHOB|nr:MFS transporter [Paracoccus seriniphilus]WCR13065.1 MFS transporter [Paracoccus seriniphilus]SNT74746.1 MFS transporter, DHA1 family, inner membrane transport protein [Paracoccus seriniphilus]